MTDFLYFDNNATTPPAPEVVHAISVAAVNAFGNPSSAYPIGRAAKKLIVESRSEIAKMINADPMDIVFTSGGTESNNWVIFSAVKFYYDKHEQLNDESSLNKPHIVTTDVEHDSVIEPILKLLDEGKIEVTFVPIDATTGSISVDSVINVLRKETVLVSVMLSNNETGAVFPVKEVMQKVKEKLASHGNVFCHTDAAQSIGKMEINVNDLNVDYLTIVGHKFYGPRIGALYAKKPGEITPLSPIFFGGNQERGFRSGTENTPMIIGLGAAARLVNDNLELYIKHMYEMKLYFLGKLREVFGNDCMHFNHPMIDEQSKCLVNTINVGFYSAEWSTDFTASAILNNMSKVVASAGAACHSPQNQQASITKPSKVLIKSGVSSDVALRSVRLSLGRQTSKQEVDEAVVQLYNAVCMAAQRKI